MSPTLKPNGDQYYEFVLSNVDNLLVLSHNKDNMRYLELGYAIKERSVEGPQQH
jgi:hypothetical protein